MTKIQYLGIWIGILLWILPVATGYSESEHEGDRLVYAVSNFDGEITYMLYNPQTGESTPILTDNRQLPSFAFNVDGRLAIASEREGNSEVYVIDTSVAESPLINITQSPATDDYPLAWSRDGRYLAYESHNDKSAQIYVWDGETAINISPIDLGGEVDHYRATWSFDGRLAILAWYGFDNDENSGDIFLWDGHTTTDLSQNPTGEERGPTWNANGEIAFLSVWNGEYDIFVWDGVSVTNGAPDRDSFTNVLPELTAYYSFPTWTNDGQLAFITTAPQDTHAQIYVWNGQTLTNVSQNPDHHNGSPTWSADGRLAYATFFSSEQVVYVRDVDGTVLLRVEGQYTPAWSPGGYLMFCSGGWTLNVWDGQEVIEIAQGREIQAQWQGGEGVVCSSG